MNMTSNDEAATRKSKRARADDGSNSGGSAATPTTTTDQSTLADRRDSRHPATAYDEPSSVATRRVERIPHILSEGYACQSYHHQAAEAKC